jgi:CDP-glucose 4,6-dehydratase
LVTPFESVYSDRRVFLTGHTGFKGSWMALWLEQLGSTVTGYALDPSTAPNHFDLLDFGLNSVIADLKEADLLRAEMERAQPEIVFHLAAQPIVLRSYEDPVETFETNVLGTARLLEACRHVKSVKAVVVITTDKCYENREWVYGYRETDALGGHDPYSASKACTELVTASFRKSFFDATSDREVLVASARAGNVVGGGDWTEHRLVPDVMRAASESKPVQIRNPRSSRPWQHVLEPLSGYLALGAKLLKGSEEFATAWNFGPAIESNLTTEQLFELMQRSWPEIQCEITPMESAPHEAGLLMLDSTKAQRELDWRPVWGIEPTLHETVRWYRTYYEEQRAISAQQIDQYVQCASSEGISWAQ